MVKYFDITSKKEWEQNGEKKTKWPLCGTLKITDEGKMFVEWNDKPKETFYVFEQKDRSKGKPQQPKEQSIDLDENAPF